jgi:hypothetical protein
MVAKVLRQLKGANGAPMPHLGTASRLAVIGGFVLLGWLALAVASATKAGADPAVPPPLPRSPAADASSTQSLLDELPVVRGAAEPLDATLAPVVAPVMPAVGKVIAPVRPAVASVTRALRPITTPIEHAVAGATSRLAPIVRPLVKVARDVVGVPADGPSESMRAAPTVVLRGASKPSSSQPSTRGSPYSVREISIPRPATTTALPRVRGGSSHARPAAPGRVATADTGRSATPIYRAPAPRPGSPPGGPALIGAVTTGSAASSRGAQAGGAPGCTAGERWDAPELHASGPVAWDRSRAVRNSAAKPSVSPD